MSGACRLPARAQQVVGHDERQLILPSEAGRWRTAAIVKLAPVAALAGAWVVTLIVWFTFCAATDSTTSGAALYVPLPGWSYFTTQVPVPLVSVNVLPAFEQAPELVKLTAPPGAVAPTPKLVPNAALAGAWVVTLIV